MAEAEPAAQFSASRETHTASPVDTDVLIVGAGISGIGMAVHLGQRCPNERYMILERRADLGGTWDLFRYPGIRSDSDMHTLGYIFEPWREEKAIADGPNILAYLNRVTDERGVRPHIRFRHTVVAARWSSAEARWSVEVDVEAEGAAPRRETITARWLYMGSGYYDYDQGHDPVFEGREDFQGDIIHPQFWPENYDYSGKRIVVIGSGATAVTLVPNLTRGGAAHVTMLQRTPTWYFIRPSEDRFANTLRRFLSPELAYRLTRFKNVRLQNYGFKFARSKPDKMGERLLAGVREGLGEEKYNAADFTPPYGPWEQRLCLVPDNDLFAEIRVGRADVITDHIECFTATGIQLMSGRHLDADVIVTATGLKLAVAGKAAFEVDGRPVNWHDHFYYKGTMFSNIPNLSLVFGYLNASWTLKADIVSIFTCRVINEMRARGADMAVPELSEADAQADDVVFDFSSGYVQRALDMLPQNGAADPWRLNQDYLHDQWLLTKGPLNDGALKFRDAGAGPVPHVPVRAADSASMAEAVPA